MRASDRLDLLAVSTDLDVGGAERQVMDLTSRLAARGWRVAIVSLKPVHHAPEALAGTGVRVTSLEFDRAMMLPTALAGLRRLERTLRPRLVHSHMIHANLLARLARIGPGPHPPLVCTSHSDGEEGDVRRLAMRLTDRWATITTHVSSTILDRYVAEGVIARERAAWVPNGIDLARFRRDAGARERVRQDLGLDDETFCWLTVGGLKPIKRHDLLVEAFELLEGTPHLLIAGDGILRDAVEARASASAAATRIAAIGPRNDPADLMSAADAFVLSSDSEALPLVLAEAAGCELPVVATDVGGCRELVDDGVSGSLVAPGDPVALAGAMRSVMQSPARDRSTMGKAGRASMERSYEIDEVVDRWEALYASLGVRRPASASTDGP